MQVRFIQLVYASVQEQTNSVAFLASNLHRVLLRDLFSAALSGCLSCTETLWDFKADLDVQDVVGQRVHSRFVVN